MAEASDYQLIFKPVTDAYSPMQPTMLLSRETSISWSHRPFSSFPRLFLFCSFSPWLIRRIDKNDRIHSPTTRAKKFELLRGDDGWKIQGFTGHTCRLLWPLLLSLTHSRLENSSTYRPPTCWVAVAKYPKSSHSHPINYQTQNSRCRHIQRSLDCTMLGAIS